MRILRAVACLTAVQLGGCMLPPPSHRAALVIDSAFIVTGIALTATHDDPGPSSERMLPLGPLSVVTGVLGVIGTAILSLRSPPAKAPAK